MWPESGWRRRCKPVGASILAGRDRMDLDNGMRLRLLSALEVLQARREAEELAQSERERALCSNACLLSRALETQEGEPVFPAAGRCSPDCGWRRSPPCPPPGAASTGRRTPASLWRRSRRRM